LAEYRKKQQELYEEAMNNVYEMSIIGEVLSKEFSDPGVKHLINMYPRYFAPIKHYMSLGMSEVDAFKQLIIDRNTLFRKFGVSGQTEDEVRKKISEVSDRYAREFTRSINGDNKLNRGKESDIFPLYTTSSPKGTYGNPSFIISAERGA
jgi:hypothetical protein